MAGPMRIPGFRREVADQAPAAGAPVAPPDAAIEPFDRRVIIVGGVVFAVEMALSTRYGFHRDELYFLDCARHLQASYVDQPVLTPLLAWVSLKLFGVSLPGLRVWPALAAWATVLVAGLIAREFGGGRRAQLLAAIATATMPALLAIDHLAGPTAFDVLAWAGLAFVVARIGRTGDIRWWLLGGVILGLGLANKHSVGFFGLAVFAGALLSGGRRLVLNRWFLAGFLIAAAFTIPDIWWQATAPVGHDRHDPPAEPGERRPGQHRELDHRPAHHVRGGAGRGVADRAALAVALQPAAVEGAGLGLRAAVRVLHADQRLEDLLPGRGVRLLAGRGRGGHRRLAGRPAGPVPQPADRHRHHHRGRPAAHAAGAARRATSAGPTRSTRNLGESIGWPQLVSTVRGVWLSLPPSQRANAVIFTGDYGEAGAINELGRGTGLPTAVSGHNTYWWWGPGKPRATTVVAVAPGPMDVTGYGGYLRQFFTSVRLVATLSNPYHIHNQEWGGPVYVCTGPRHPWAQMWPRLRHYD